MFNLKGRLRADCQSSMDEYRNEIDFTPLGAKKKIQQMYLPVKVGFLFADVMNWKSLFSTSMSRKGEKQLFVFKKVK